MLSSVILLFVIGGLIVFANKRPIYGLMYYFGIRMLIPYTARVFSFSFNTMAFICVLIFMLSSLRYTYRASSVIDKRYIHLVKFLFLSIFCLSILGTVVPYSFQWSGIFQLFVTEFLPSLMLAMYLKNKKDYITFCKWIAVFGTLFSIYAIYTYIYSSNPIFDFFNTSSRISLDLDEYSTGRMGLSGIAVGIYDDKIACSLICMLVCMFVFCTDCIVKYLRMVAFSSSFIALYLTTQRTGLLCLLLFCVAYYLNKVRYSKNKLFFFIVVGVAVLFVFSGNKFIDDLFSGIFSVFTDNSQSKNAVGGSNIEMRIAQLSNCIDYLNITSLLQGAGYGFAGYYYKYIWNIELYGNDSRFLGFESYLFQTLMNSGIIGVFCWGRFFRELFSLVRNDKTNCCRLFGIFYVIAILMTDASASLYIFFFIFVMIYKYSSVYVACENNQKQSNL